MTREINTATEENIEYHDASEHESATEITSAPDASGNVLIEATDKGTGRKIAVNYNFGATIEEALEKFGPDVVMSNFRRASTITAQAAMRRLAKAGKSDAEIQEAFASWKPGVAMERISDPVAALKARFATLGEEDRAKILAELMGQ